MSMPQIPEEKNRPTLCEVTIDIFKSVALEETALSHILNAEAERCQAMIQRFACCRNCTTLDDLNQSIRQTEKMLSTIIMKEWLLLKKLETAYEINQNMTCKPAPCNPCNPCNPCKHCNPCKNCNPCKSCNPCKNNHNPC